MSRSPGFPVIIPGMAGSGSSLPRITPDAIAATSQCLHYWELQCHGDRKGKLSEDAGPASSRERGIEKGEALIKTLKGVRSPDWKGLDWQSGYEATRDLMVSGPDWVHEGVLLGGCAPVEGGIPDLLRKDSGPSRLGEHGYVPVDIRDHKKVTPEDRIQVAACGLLLEPILGKRPSEGGVWLNTGRIEYFDLSGEYEIVDGLIKAMVRIRKGEGGTRPVRCRACSRCAWREACFGARSSVPPA